MQEESPEDFKEFSMTARKLEAIANEQPVIVQVSGEEEVKEVASSQAQASYAESFAKFLGVLQESKYQKNFTFSMYKILKNALIKKYLFLFIFNQLFRNYEWVKFMIETVGIDMTQERFR